MRIYSAWIMAAVAIGRIVIGIIFLWAGLEKLIGTPGGFSAAGFLAHGTAGTLGWPFVTADAQGPFNPTMGFWVDLSKNSGMMAVVNFLVVFGELGIGVSLVLGLLTRFGAAMGTLIAVGAVVGAWVGSESFGTLSTWGPAFDGLYLLPALIGGVVLGGVVAGATRLFTGGSYLEPRPI